jgi:hypothetical protein
MSDRTDRPAPEDLPALAPSRRDGPGQLGGHQDGDGPCLCRKSHPPRWELLFGFGGGRMSWLLSRGRSLRHDDRLCRFDWPTLV